MCGIAGALSFESSTFAITPDYITRMRDAMTHRGPDGAGLWVSPDGRVGLGHRRLSIIDLSDAAAQPMSNEDGSLWISYNGEIYNHPEIRAVLDALGGHSWKTDHSDTEVILHAFEQWGIECLHRFRGMFAFALWDSRSRELWLVRDRIGIKPLYYSIHDSRIVFASETKALLQDPDQRRAVDEEAFYHFLTFLISPAPRTMFEGINKLPPATWMRVNERGEVRTERYWDVWDHTTPLSGAPEREITGRLIAELRTSVKLRKAADVPVGVFLSGGIDSSTNAALFSEGEGASIRTFTVGYDGDYPSYRNENAYARKMASLIGAEHHEIVLSQQDLIEFLPRMVHLQDEPIADPVCVPVYFVSKLARDNGVIVCQVGEGADELFWGYPAWRDALRFQRWMDAPGVRAAARLGASLLDVCGKGDSARCEWLRRAAHGRPVFWGGATAFGERLKRRILSHRMRKRFASLDPWEVLRPPRESFLEKAWEKSHLNWMTYLDLRFRLPELLLMRVDKMSMGVSLEGRVPFLDHKFVELALSIPEAVKTRNSTLKYILKESVRGLIPDELIDRPKQGFGVPVYEWFFDRLGHDTRRDVREFCRSTDLLDAEAADEVLSGGRGALKWCLMNAAAWHKQWIA